jgi:hypothetical protein
VDGTGGADLADVFEKAGRHMEREKRLLDREPEPASSSETSTPPFAPWPDCRADLIGANAQYHPATLFAGTPAAGLKKIVLRVMNVYTYRQILFNAAVVRILNRWDARLQTLSGELSGLSRRLTDRVNRQVALIEERRSLWEARLAGQLGALEDRTSAAESDIAELQSRARKERARVDSLEDSVRRLEAVLARERETAGAGTHR